MELSVKFCHYNLFSRYKTKTQFKENFPGTLCPKYSRLKQYLFVQDKADGRVEDKIKKRERNEYFVR